MFLLLVFSLCTKYRPDRLSAHNTCTAFIYTDLYTERSLILWALQNNILTKDSKLYIKDNTILKGSVILY
jgi:hypothetical protein